MVKLVPTANVAVKAFHDYCTIILHAPFNFYSWYLFKVFQTENLMELLGTE